MGNTPADAQKLRDLAVLRRVRDRMDREYAQPLDVEALARGAHMSAGHLSREFRLAYGESPYGYLMTARFERAMALLRRGDLGVTEVCFAVGCSSLVRSVPRFTELVGVPPSTYRREALDTARATAGIPSCVVKQVTRPVRIEKQLPRSRTYRDHDSGTRQTLTTDVGEIMTSTEGIKTVLHPVTDLAASKAVYTALLGVEPSSDAPYYVGYEVEGQQIGLVPNGSSQGMTSPIAYWHVADIEAKLAEVTAAGAKVKDVPRDVANGRLVATFTDPDGNVLGLIQDPQ